MLMIQTITLVLIGFVAVMWVLVKRDEQKHRCPGYWVEYISSDRLRGNTDNFAVVYHEANWCQFFYGKITGYGKPDQLSFPDDAAWQMQSPDWLNGKREIVLARIESSIKHIEIMTTPEFPSS